MMECCVRLVQRTSLCALMVCVAFVGRVMAASDAQSRQILQQALENKNPETRKQAVQALSLVAAQFLTPLEGMLHDDDMDVRLAAVATLAEVKRPQAVAALRDALDDEAPEVSFAAAKALWGLHDAAGKEALVAILAGETKTTSGFVAKKKREAVRTMHSRRSLLLMAARRGIGFVPVPYLGVGVASMQALLNDPGVTGRATAALLLARDTDPATLDPLREALNDKEWSVRAAAVHALSLRRDPRLKTELPPLFDDDNQAVRLRAAAGYVKATARQTGTNGNASDR
jgi:HEAT repeat protein